jgi:hypothetical protein
MKTVPPTTAEGIRATALNCEKELGRLRGAGRKSYFDVAASSSFFFVWGMGMSWWTCRFPCKECATFEVTFVGSRRNRWV